MFYEKTRLYVVVGLLCLTGGTKEEPRACYSCLHIAVLSPAGRATGNTGSDTLREELCDQTESSIRDYERRNSSTANLNAGGAQIVQDQKTTCARK